MRKFKAIVGIKTFDVNDGSHQSLTISEFGRHYSGCVKTNWNVSFWDDEKIENWVEACITQGRFDEPIKVVVVRNYLVKIEMPDRYVEIETNDDDLRFDLHEWSRSL